MDFYGKKRNLNVKIVNFLNIIKELNKIAKLKTYDLVKLKFLQN